MTTLEREGPLTGVDVNWRASKEVMSAFTKKLLARGLRYHDVRNMTAGRDSVDMFIYNLGHPGRPLRDFPQYIPLLIPVTTKKELPWFLEPVQTTVTTVGNLYAQLADTAQQHLTQSDRQKAGEFPLRLAAYTPHIDALRLISRIGQDDMIEVTFHSREGTLGIIRMVHGDIDVKD